MHAAAREVHCAAAQSGHPGVVFCGKEPGSSASMLVARPATLCGQGWEPEHLRAQTLSIPREVGTLQCQGWHATSKKLRPSMNNVCKLKQVVASTFGCIQA